MGHTFFKFEDFVLELPFLESGDLEFLVMLLGGSFYLFVPRLLLLSQMLQVFLQQLALCQNFFQLVETCALITELILHISELLLLRRN